MSMKDLDERNKKILDEHRRKHEETVRKAGQTLNGNMRIAEAVEITLGGRVSEAVRARANRDLLENSAGGRTAVVAE
jgi:hypothetical protein